jgi:hypothetical protein
MVGYLVLRQTAFPLGDALKRVHEGEEPHPAIKEIEKAIEKIDTESGMP